MNRNAHEIARAVGGSRWVQGYVKGKLATDPVFDESRAALSECRGPIIDLGCGLGLNGLWLRWHGIDADYRGCDLSAWKIAAGQQTAERKGLRDFRMEVADMTEFPLAGAAAICAFDVLHYLAPDAQTTFVSRLAEAARSGAGVLIRTGVRGCGWRSGATLAEEWWTRLSGWIGGGSVNFPRLEDLKAAFEAGGCAVSVRPCWGRTPFSSHWLEVTAIGRSFAACADRGPQVSRRS